MTLNDPKTPTPDKKFFKYFCSSHKELSACQKSKWDLYGFLRYFLIRKKINKRLAKIYFSNTHALFETNFPSVKYFKLLYNDKKE